MNLTSNKPLNFLPELQFHEMPAGSYKCVTDSITNYCGADFQSCKKPGFSNSMMNSSSRMSISSTSRSNLARPINAKSESCLQHKRGHCNYGADCIFSHDMPEDQYRLMNRARLCRFFMNGKNCPYGNRCHFLHQNETGRASLWERV